MGDFKFQRLGTMVDCSRGAVMNVETVKKWIDTTADLGYNTLMLYTEDTYEIEGEPFFGYLRGRYTQDELREIDDYAAARDMELIPCIQTLAHLEAIFCWEEYDDIRDCNSILLVGEEKTYKLIDKMFATLKKCFRSKTVNVGMDEAFMLGRGKYQDINGFKNRFDILLGHLKRVSEIAKKYDYELIMWGDMFFRLLGNGYNGKGNNLPPAEVSAMIPDNINLIYWDYYSTDRNNYDKRIKDHCAVKENIWFAGGLWTWTGFTPHIEYSVKASSAAIDACTANGVENIFFTLWGDDGSECSKFALLPALYSVAQLAKGNSDMDKIKAGFAEKYGIGFDEFMLLDLPETPNDPKLDIDYSDRKDAIRNPDKYMLFNDCFLGVYDATVKEGSADSYALCAQKLKALGNHEEFGYLFSCTGALCDVLEVKYELGCKTRKTYDAKDKAELANLILEYDKLLALLDEFYRNFRDLWFKENKAIGFETHDIRFGGLIMRIKHCRERIEAYVNGEIPQISELEERLLNPTSKEKGKSIWYNGWHQIAFIDCLF